MSDTISERIVGMCMIVSLSKPEFKTYRCPLLYSQSPTRAAVDRNLLRWAADRNEPAQGIRFPLLFGVSPTLGDFLGRTAGKECGAIPEKEINVLLSLLVRFNASISGIRCASK